MSHCRLLGTAFSLTAALFLGGPLARAQELVPIGVNFSVREDSAPGYGLGAAATLDGERVLLVWQTRTSHNSSLLELRGRLFAADGVPLGPETTLVSATPGLNNALATAPDGSFLLVWRAGDSQGSPLRLFSRRFDLNLVPLGPVRDLGIDAIPGIDAEPPALACGSSECVLAWYGLSDGLLRTLYQRLAADGSPLGTPRVAGLLQSSFVGPISVALGDDGSVAVAWTQRHPGGPFASVFGIAFLSVLDSADDLRTIRLLQDSRLFAPKTLGLAWSPGGEIVVALDETFGHPAFPASRVKVQRFDAQGVALTEPSYVDDGSGFEPALLWSPDLDRFVLGWWSVHRRAAAVVRLLDADGVPTGVPLEVSRNVNLNPSFQSTRPILVDLGGGEVFAGWESGSAAGGPFLAQRLSSTSPCLGFPPSPCLAVGEGGRFLLFVNFRTQNGVPALASSSRLTPDSAAFTFTSPEVPEVFAKMIDGTGLNDQFWAFFGSLTDQEFSLVVIDRVAALTRAYHNPPGRLASFGDTSAFPVIALPSSELLAPLKPTTEEGASTPCPPVTGRLCLLDGQFYVGVQWTDFEGGSGSGQPVPATANGGYFTFFSPDNVELAVKLLDGRGVNGHYWVFYASLTSVPFTLRIQDAAGNVVAQYVNPSGNMASVADVEAF